MGNRFGYGRKKEGKQDIWDDAGDTRGPKKSPRKIKPRPHMKPKPPKPKTPKKPKLVPPGTNDDTKAFWKEHNK